MILNPQAQWKSDICCRTNTSDLEEGITEKNLHEQKSASTCEKKTALQQAQTISFSGLVLEAGL